MIPPFFSRADTQLAELNTLVRRLRLELEKAIASASTTDQDDDEMREVSGRRWGRVGVGVGGRCFSDANALRLDYCCC